MIATKRIAWAVALMALAACGGSGVAGKSGIGKLTEAVTGGICPGPATVAGIDVSEYQGGVDWGAVKGAGYGFGIARVGDGYYVDPYFGGNWANMAGAGIVRGAYQFFEPGEDPVAQANIVISRVGVLGPNDLPVMLDLEISGGQSPGTIVANTHAWVNAITAGTGKAPFIYTGAYFWDGSVGSGDFSNLALNVAWYGTNCPGVPNAWAGPGWTFHQWTDSAGVPGVGGGVDADVFNGDFGQLLAFAGGGQTVDQCSSAQAAACGNYGCGCADNQCGGVFCPGNSCSPTRDSQCAAFGCGCANGDCGGGYCPGDGCEVLEDSNCAKFGCTCVDHACNGGYCPGPGCTAKEINDCGNYGCGCVDHACNGGYCPGPGCTAKEINDCGSVGCGCTDHQCQGGVACGGNNCTALEMKNCGAYGCGCVDHACNGGYCPGPGCSVKETANCANYGCGCVDGTCNGGFCAGTGCTPHETLYCNGMDAGCSAHECVDSAGNKTSIPGGDPVAFADAGSSDETLPDGGPLLKGGVPEPNNILPDGGVLPAGMGEPAPTPTPPKVTPAVAPPATQPATTGQVHGGCQATGDSIALLALLAMAALFIRRR